MNARSLGLNEVTAKIYLKKVFKIASKFFCTRDNLKLNQVNISRYTAWFVKAYLSDWNKEELYEIYQNNGEKKYCLVPFGTLLSSRGNMHYHGKVIEIEPISEEDALEFAPRKKWRRIEVK